MLGSDISAETLAYRRAMSAELDDIKEEIRQSSASLDSFIAVYAPMIQEMHKAMFGNGDPKHGISFRLSWIEEQVKGAAADLDRRFARVPTWQWWVEKALWPIMLALIVYLLNH